MTAPRSAATAQAITQQAEPPTDTNPQRIKETYMVENCFVDRVRQERDCFVVAVPIRKWSETRDVTDY